MKNVAILSIESCVLPTEDGDLHAVPSMVATVTVTKVVGGLSNWTPMVTLPPSVTL